MGVEIKYPNITAPTEAGKLEQVRGYLFQLVDQLKWALNTVDGGSSGSTNQQTNRTTNASKSEAEAQATFNSVKALIIKSADIVDSYYEAINKRLEGYYVAQSDFGTYMQSTELEIDGESTSITQIYSNLQAIITDIENLEHSLIDVNAYIRSGELYTNDEGVPIYGLEIGQTNYIDDVKVFNKYARFTSDRLSFYDQNDTEVAYISDYKLYITNAEVTGTLTLGGYIIETSNGLAFRWKG